MVLSPKAEKFANAAENVTAGSEFVVRAMTYNIHSCVNTYREVNPYTVARIIKALEADVVALQEVDAEKNDGDNHNQAKTIAERLNMNYVFFPVEDNGLHAFGLAVLSRFPIGEYSFTRLPSHYATLIPRKRGAIRATIHTPAGPIHLFNTHLSVYKGEQRKQMKVLLDTEWLSSIMDNQPAIFCGDLNAGSLSRTYRRVANYLTDVQKALDDPWLPRPTFHARSPFLRIDHMFISRHFTPLKVEVTINPDTRTASDHLPLIAELTMNGK
ncbi:MAG: endonuclease/exonuclease/phosphatase family protein [Thermodesulfobacteriota bacterium]